MDANYSIGGTQLAIPRGTPALPAMQLDMTLVYQAEGRLPEVRRVTPDTAPELAGFFNEAANITSKYLAWIEYEILQAQKYNGLAKSTVVLEKAPAEFAKLKDTGIKYNEDFREALVARDPECQKTLDVLNGLKASKAFLESKMWTFIRAFNSCDANASRKSHAATTPNFSGAIGDTMDSNNFMGDRKRST